MAQGEGLTRRLWRGRRACSPMGRSIVCPEESPCAFYRDVSPWFFSPSTARRGAGGERKAPCFFAGILLSRWFAEYGPKVSKGERREAGIQWIQPPKAVSDPEFRQTTSGTHGSAGRADCLPRGKPFGAPAGAYLCPRWGLTRRLRRGLGLVVPRGAHTFLSVAKEKCAKESQRHGDSGKKASIAHFGGGARYVARSTVGQLTHAIVRARSSPFSAVKMGGPFSLRCLSPLCSPAVGVGQAYPLRGGKFQCGWEILQRG